jgi:hypothetical protein
VRASTRLARRRCARRAPLPPRRAPRPHVRTRITRPHRSPHRPSTAQCRCLAARDALLAHRKSRQPHYAPPCRSSRAARRRAPRQAQHRLPRSRLPETSCRPMPTSPPTPSLHDAAPVPTAINTTRAPQPPLPPPSATIKGPYTSPPSSTAASTTAQALPELPAPPPPP